MSAPLIIAGPAIVQFNAQTYYTEGDVTVAHTRETFAVASSMHGTLREHLVAQAVRVSFKPVGALDVVAKYLAHAVTAVGTLLIDPAAPKSVVVWGRDGRKTTWGAGFISKLPNFNLSAVATAIGDMEITALGNPTKDLDAVDAWHAFASAALADVTFDETKIVTPRYLATWGTALVDCESEAGFTIEPAIGVSLKNVANWGYVNAILSDLTLAARFVPVGIDEDDLWAALALQGASAILPGESLSKAGEDLVIEGGAVSFTLHKAGPKSATTRYGLEPLRVGEVAFVTSRTFTAGAANPLWTVAFS